MLGEVIVRTLDCECLEDLIEPCEMSIAPYTKE